MLVKLTDALEGEIVAIDSYAPVAAATPLDKLPRIVLSNSAYHIPSISSCFDADCCFVLG